MMMPTLVHAHPLAFNMRHAVQSFLREAAYPREIKYIVDVGACIGSFAIPYTVIFPDAEILCVEPSKHNFPYLEYNIKNLPQIKAVKLAAHNTRGNVRISAPTIIQRSKPDSDADTGLISIYGESTQYAEAVMTDRLDNIVTKTVDWLKIDVEGNEENVLMGAERILSQDKPMLQIEIRNENQRMAKKSSARLLLQILGKNYVPAGSFRGDLLFRPGAKMFVDG